MFCEIVSDKIPSTKVNEEDQILSFKALNPVAPVHFLVVPKAHIENVNAITADNSAVDAHNFEPIPQIAASQGITSYRVISNCGADAGQSVMHLHFHVIGGTELGEKIL